MEIHSPTLNTSLQRYCRTFLNHLLQAILLVLIVTVGLLVLLYGSRVLWNLYLQTHIGQEFCLYYAGQAEAINAMFADNLLLLAWDVSTSAFLTCLTVAALCQVLHLTRYFYLSRGFFGKLLCFGVPLSFLVSLDFQGLGYMTRESAIGLVLIPTLCMFTYCFKFTLDLLPEASTAIRQAPLLFREAKLMGIAIFRQKIQPLIGKSNT